MQKGRFLFRQENLTYVVMWLLIAVAPLLSEWLALYSGASEAFKWMPILRAWEKLLPFLLVFLLHNWLLAPLMVSGHRRSHYFIGVLALVALFTVYECTNRPPRHDRTHHQPPLELQEGHNPPPFHEAGPNHQGPRFDGKHRHEGGPKPDEEWHQPMMLMEHDLVAIIILILMLGMNLGVKFYFRQQADDRKLKALEHQNLEQQLAYLRYQVNPHFLMNTLNNIHALIDVDAESAQTAVVELSRLLRYSLYDAERPRVALQKELAFLGNYLELMRIRYASSVDIRLEVPNPVPSVTVPPLLFASFVENAFKHGVSYRQSSFVHITFTEANGRLRFTCTNSRLQTQQSSAPETPEGGSGLGLRNVRQRLDLLFPEDYTLTFKEQEDSYNVTLDIPLKTT